jgi:cytochrome c553
MKTSLFPRRLALPLWGLLLLCGSAAVQAQPAAAGVAPTLAERQVRTWAATCAACHGTEGRDQGAIPAIAGRGAETLYRALIEFKAGQRPAATVMHQHAKGYSDDELRRLAQYFAALPVR